MANFGGRAFGDGGDVTLDQAALDALVHSPAGPTARLLVRVGEVTTQGAKRAAPVGDRSSKTPEGHPSGWLRSNIGWAVGRLDGDLVVDIVSDAVTSPASNFPGEPYALENEAPEYRTHGIPQKWAQKQGPYLRPAFLDALRSVIGG